MNRVVHFEIHAAEPKRAIAFYAKVFGWKFEPYGPPDFYWLITTGESKPENTGINGGLLKRMGPNPDPKDPTPVIGYACTIDVENLDATAAAIEAAGGSLALAKHAIPGLAWVAYYKDTEANIFGIYQADKNAK
jgi:predicted enzyme related to lactoylglutathione lyase